VVEEVKRAGREGMYIRQCDPVFIASGAAMEVNSRVVAHK
jgi:hypothetical protein